MTEHTMKYLLQYQIGHNNNKSQVFYHTSNGCMSLYGPRGKSCCIHREPAPILYYVTSGFVIFVDLPELKCCEQTEIAVSKLKLP